MKTDNLLQFKHNKFAPNGRRENCKTSKTGTRSDEGSKEGARNALYLTND